MLKRLLLLLCIVSGSIQLTFGQQDLTLYYMNNIPQFNYTNASFMPRSGLNLGLPLISSNYFSVGNSGFKANQVFYKNASDSTDIDTTFLNRLATQNFLTANAQVDIFSFGIRGGKNYFAFNVTEKFSSKLIYPKGFLLLAWEGNGKTLLGNRASLDGLGLDLMHSREYAFTFARELNEKLNIGVRVKYLNGLENISTKYSKMGLTTDAVDYSFTTDGSIDVRSSGINQLTKDFDPSSYKLLRKNHGAAIDLGANYKYDEKISFSAAINDLGFIKWKEDIKNYKDDDFTFTYSGFTFKQLLDTDTASKSATEAMIDSLSNTFSGTEYYDAYTTALTSRVLIGGAYEINKSNSAGLLFQTEINKGVLRPALAVSYTTRYKNFVSASVSYSILNRSANNLGLGFSLNAWPVQFYLISDNVLAPIRQFQGTKNVHLRFGINLTFMRPKEDRDKDGIKDKKDECPDDAGVPEFNGCPDKDGDGLIDKRDTCPEVAGPKELNGCPDKDGDGIIDMEDDCIDEPGAKEFKGCPDRDGDAIIDKNDECPDDKGISEFDGCPDTDNDKVADKNDECPETPGTVENNGCPEIKLHLISEDGTIIKTAVKNKNGVFVFDELPTDQNFFFQLEGEEESVNEVKIMIGDETKNALRFKEGFFKFDNIDADQNRINLLDEEDVLIKLAKEEEEILKRLFSNLEFDFSKDVITERSYPYLEELAELMVKHEKWRIKLSGHTDNVGSPDANMTLSRKRVEAVKKALIVLGVNSDRIVLRWFGSTVPISDNSSEEGRQKNRRVEMKIIE